MAQGVITIETVSSFVLITIFSIICILMSIKSINLNESVWKDTQTTKTIQILTTVTLIFYFSAICTSLVFFLEILCIGYNYQHFDPIPETTFLIFALLYIIGLFLTLLTWIKRVHHAFDDTEYSFKPIFIKTAHIIFYAICILGLVTLTVYAFSAILNVPLLYTIRQVFGGIWALSFATEIFIILYAYLSRLSQLRTQCQITVQSLESSFDRTAAEVMSKLIELQIKLSILLVTMIIGTFSCIFTAIILTPYISYFWLALNAFIGFICTYCAVPGHHNIYKYVFIVCILCCKKYVHTYDELILFAIIEHDDKKSNSIKKPVQLNVSMAQVVPGNTQIVHIPVSSLTPSKLDGKLSTPTTDTST